MAASISLDRRSWVETSYSLQVQNSDAFDPSLDGE
jgi:hypothetical protein